MSLHTPIWDLLHTNHSQIVIHISIHPQNIQPNVTVRSSLPSTSSDFSSPSSHQTLYPSPPSSQSLHSPPHILTPRSHHIDIHPYINKSVYISLSQIQAIHTYLNTAYRKIIRIQPARVQVTSIPQIRRNVIQSNEEQR